MPDTRSPTTPTPPPTPPPNPQSIRMCPIVLLISSPSPLHFPCKQIDIKPALSLSGVSVCSHSAQTYIYMYIYMSSINWHRIIPTIHQRWEMLQGRGVFIYKKHTSQYVCVPRQILSGGDTRVQLYWHTAAMAMDGTETGTETGMRCCNLGRREWSLKC